jgi:hypothetical protein
MPIFASKIKEMIAERRIEALKKKNLPHAQVN